MQRSMVNDEESNRLNATALRRIDSAFSKLHGTASQVAVYRFNPATQSWDKTDTVGCLFLYERNEPPQYGLVVMNRKNTNNFIQYFGADAQVVLHTPYLLLRSVDDLISDPNDGTQAIHCIWFYEAQDCATSAKILRNMGLTFEGETMDGNGKAMGMNAALERHLFQILQGKKKSPQKRAVARILTAEELESQMLNESENNITAHQSAPPASCQSNGSLTMHNFGRSPRSSVVKPSPLTQDQLLQALLYLLKNDSEFVGKIHEAYVKSFQQAHEGPHL